MILYIQSCAVTLTRITKIDYRQEFMEFYIKCLVRGLSWWLRGKELACQGRRHGFWEDLTCSGARSPWTQLLSLCSRAQKPQLLSPRAATTEAQAPRDHAPQQKKLLQWEAHVSQLESSPHTPQLGKNPCTAAKTQCNKTLIKRKSDSCWKVYLVPKQDRNK